MVIQSLLLFILTVHYYASDHMQSHVYTTEYIQYLIIIQYYS